MRKPPASCATRISGLRIAQRRDGFAVLDRAPRSDHDPARWRPTRRSSSATRPMTRRASVDVGVDGPAEDRTLVGVDRVQVRPSPLRSSSRRPGRPFDRMPAVASLERERAIAGDRVARDRTVGEVRGEDVAAVAGDRPPSRSRCGRSDDAVTGVRRSRPARRRTRRPSPFWAPKASVTTRMPSAVIVNPYGVGPDEAITVGAPSSPSSATGNATIAFVPRSVTMRVRPAGSNPTCAGPRRPRAGTPPRRSAPVPGPRGGGR